MFLKFSSNRYEGNKWSYLITLNHKEQGELLLRGGLYADKLQKMDRVSLYRGEYPT